MAHMLFRRLHDQQREAARNLPPPPPSELDLLRAENADLRAQLEETKRMVEDLTAPTTAERPKKR